MKCLLIGPVSPAWKQVCGARVVFHQLITYTVQEGIPVTVLNTAHQFTGISRLFTFLRLNRDFFRHIRSSSFVFLNVSGKGMRILFPWLWLWCRLFNKPLVFRPFGLNKVLWTTPGLGWIMRHNFLNLVETQTAISRISSKGNTLHFPNHRFPGAVLSFRRTWKKRLVFVGLVRASKGIDMLLEMIMHASSGTLIHIYGPIHDAQYAFLEHHPAYQGSLHPDQVQETIAQYDMLILPSLHATEGYAGVIIEAFSVGVPAICTPWNALHEVVKHGYNGFITPRSDARAFLNTITCITDEVYKELSRNCRRDFYQHYDSRKVLTHIFREIEKRSTLNILPKDMPSAPAAAWDMDKNKMAFGN